MNTLIDKEGAARALNVSLRTLERALQRREIGCVHVAGRVRFTQAQIDEFIARNTREAVAPSRRGLRAVSGAPGR